MRPRRLCIYEYVSMLVTKVYYSEWQNWTGSVGTTFMNNRQKVNLYSNISSVGNTSLNNNQQTNLYSNTTASFMSDIHALNDF
jgi:hypothetical protein